MFRAFGQLFNALFVLFTATERGAKALDHLARVAEEEAGVLADAAAASRAQRAEALGIIVD